MNNKFNDFMQLSRDRKRLYANHSILKKTSNSAKMELFVISAPVRTFYDLNLIKR